jgi:hypothetical protein
MRLVRGVAGTQVTCRQQCVECAVDGVARPAIRRVLKILTDIAAFPARTDEGHDLLADGMPVTFLGVTDGFQRFAIALARFLDDLAPGLVVGSVKAVVETNDRGFGGAIQALGQVASLGDFLASRLEHAHAGEQFVEKGVDFLLGVALTTFHRTSRVAPFFGVRRPFAVERIPGRFEGHDGIAERVTMFLRQKNEDGRVLGTLGPGIGNDGLLVGLPAVLNPDVERLVVVPGQSFVEADDRRAHFAGLALHDAYLRQRFPEARLEEFGA